MRNATRAELLVGGMLIGTMLSGIVVLIVRLTGV